MESCLLGLYPRPMAKKVGNRCINLALALARRQTSMNWKAATGTLECRWESDVLNWAGAEGKALRREETRALCRRPIASL